MKVFISFSQRDHRLVHHLSSALSEHGITPLVATLILSPGRRLDEKVQGLIEQSDVIVVLNTPTASRSPWVQQEIGYAQALSKTIIPLKTRGAKIAAMLDGHEYYRFKAADPGHDFSRIAGYLREYAKEHRIKLHKSNDQLEKTWYRLLHMPWAMFCPLCEDVDVHVWLCCICGEWVCVECGGTIPYDSKAESQSNKRKANRTDPKRNRRKATKEAA